MQDRQCSPLTVTASPASSSKIPKDHNTHQTVTHCVTDIDKISQAETNELANLKPRSRKLGRKPNLKVEDPRGKAN